MKGVKARAANYLAGKKRHQYSVTFKADVSNTLEQPDRTQESTAEKFCADQSQVLRYAKSRVQIMKNVADDYRKKEKKTLKERKCEKYKHVYSVLCFKFQRARARGQRVDFHWLWSKGRVYHQRR